MTPLTKKCTKCGEVKELGEYHKAKLGKFGLSARCKECLRKWAHQNKEAINSRRKAWRKNNPDKPRGDSRLYRERHPEKIKEYWRSVSDRAKSDKKLYYDKNRHRLIERSANWYAQNHERVNQAKRAGVANLSDEYIKEILRQTNIPIAPEVIKMKRLHIQIKRRIKDETDKQQKQISLRGSNN